MIYLFFLFQILNEIAQHKIKIYEFPECDDEEENKVQKKLRVSTSSSSGLEINMEVQEHLSGAGTSSTSVGPSPGNWLATEQFLLGVKLPFVYLLQSFMAGCPSFHQLRLFRQSKSSTCPLLTWAVCFSIGTMNK